MCASIKNLKEEYDWLKEVDACALRCAIYLEDSFKNYFAKRSNHPIFKSKFNKQSYKASVIRSTYKGKDYSNIILNLQSKIIKLLS